MTTSIWPLACRARKNDRSDQRADEAAHDHDAGHLQVRAPAPQMAHDAADAGAGDLRGRRRDRDGRRDSVEHQQRRGEESTAYPEHARENADEAAERDDQQRIDRLAGDREVDVHRRSMD